MTTSSSRSQASSWPTWSVPTPDLGLLGVSPTVPAAPVAAPSNQAALADAGLAIDQAIDQVDPSALDGALAQVPPLGPPAAPVDPDAQARFAASTALDSVRSKPVRVPLPKPADLAAWWPRRAAYLADAVAVAAEQADAMGEDHDEVSAPFAAGRLRSALDHTDAESRAYTLVALPRPSSSALARACALQVPAVSYLWRLDPTAASQPDAKKPLLGKEAATASEAPLTFRPRVDRGAASENQTALAHAEASASARGVAAGAGAQVAQRDGTALRQAEVGVTGAFGTDRRASGTASAGASHWQTDAEGKATKTGASKGDISYQDGAWSASGELSHFDGADGYNTGFGISADGLQHSLGYTRLDAKGEPALRANAAFGARGDGYSASGDLGYKAGDYDLGVSALWDSAGELGGRLSFSAEDFGAGVGAGVAWSDTARGAHLEASAQGGPSQASFAVGRRATFTEVSAGPDGRHRVAGADAVHLGVGGGVATPLGVSGSARRSAHLQWRESRSFDSKAEAEAWRAQGEIRDALKLTAEDLRNMRPGDSVERQGVEQGGRSNAADAFGSALGFSTTDDERVSLRIERLDGDRARVTREVVQSGSLGFDARFAVTGSASARDLEGSTQRASIDLDLAHPGADAALVRFRDGLGTPRSPAVLASTDTQEDSEGDSGQIGFGGLSATRTSNVVSRTETEEGRERKESEGSWGLSWLSDWFGYGKAEGAESHTAEAGFFTDNADRDLTTTSRVNHGDTQMNREGLLRATGVDNDLAKPRPDVPPSGPWAVETSFTDQGADRIRDKLEGYAGARNVTPGVARAGALMRESTGMEAEDKAAATLSADGGADALGFMRAWAGKGGYERYVSLQGEDGGLMGMGAAADEGDLLAGLESLPADDLAAPPNLSKIRERSSKLLGRERTITDYSKYPELPDALRQQGLALVRGLKGRYDALLARAEAARGGNGPSPEAEEARRKMTAAFEAMEKAYAEARAEMKLHLTPREATPAAVSRRDELCSPTYWWDTDESPRYAEADQAMAEGEKARQTGAKREVEAMQPGATGTTTLEEAAGAYRFALSALSKSTRIYASIRTRNPEVFGEP